MWPNRLVCALVLLVQHACGTQLHPALLTWVLCMEFNVPELPMTGAGRQKHFKALERSSDVLPESGRRRDLEQSALRLSLAAALAEYGMCRPPVAGVRRGAA